MTLYIINDHAGSEVYAVVDSIPEYVSEWACCNEFERYEVNGAFLEIYSFGDDPVCTIYVGSEEEGEDLARDMGLTNQ